MRRASFLSIFAVLLLAGGLTCFVEKARLFGDVEDSLVPVYAGMSMIVLAATASLLATMAFRHACKRLQRQIAELNASGKFTPVALDGQFVPLVRAINEMIDSADRTVSDTAIKLKELQIQLKVATAQRHHAEAILYSINDAVLVTDPFDDLILANEAAAKAFKFDLDATGGRRPVQQVVGDATLVQLIRDMRASGSVNGRRIVEHDIKDGGQARSFKVTLSCVSSRADEPAGVVAVLHDVTREREVAQMKNDFVSNVSHELRTPLASIKAYVEMLIDGEADDEKTTREFYEVIQNEANRLGRLIDNILNISRIESGLVKVTKGPQSLTVILKEAIEVITPQASMKQITIEEHLTPVFYQTMADKDMLYQAVLNLLSNSVKYTPEQGKITIQTIVDESSRKVITRISDTGVGIPPKDLPFVFDKFYRVDANNRMAKGTGLGLSLVKHIIETVHHGKIFLESEVGKGSTFSFELELSQ